MLCAFRSQQAGGEVERSGDDGLPRTAFGAEQQVERLAALAAIGHRQRLLLESDVELATGDRIEIELPHAGDITAVVIWAKGRLFGCQFEGPVSPATLSAVELKGNIGPAPEMTNAVGPAPGNDEDRAAPGIDDAMPEGVQEVIDRSREQIARAAGINADRIRIFVEY